MSLTSRVIVMPSGLTTFRTNGIYGPQGVNPAAGTVQDAIGGGISPAPIDPNTGDVIPSLLPPPPAPPPGYMIDPTDPQGLRIIPISGASSGSGLLAGFDTTTLLLILGAGVGLWFFAKKG